MGQSCWALVAQALLVFFNYVQRCQRIMDAAAVECGPMASPRIKRRHGSPPHEEQPRTLHLRANAGPCIFE
jgi:hypothetical protein